MKSSDPEIVSIGRSYIFPSAVFKKLRNSASPGAKKLVRPGKAKPRLLEEHREYFKTQEQALIAAVDTALEM
eukprot:1378933-Prorocentrum_lima.AAC.1